HGAAGGFPAILVDLGPRPRTMERSPCGTLRRRSLSRHFQSSYLKFAGLGTALCVLLGLAFSVLQPATPGERAGPAPVPAAPPVPEVAAAAPGNRTDPPAPPADTAVLRLRLPPGARVEMMGQDFGHAEEFRFRPLAPRRWYRDE